MLKSITVAVLCGKLIECGTSLLGSLYSPRAQARTRATAARDWLKGRRLHNLLFALTCNHEDQPKPAYYCGELLLYILAVFEKKFGFILVILLLMAYFLFFYSWFSSSSDKQVKENKRSLFSTDAVIQEDNCWSDVICCHVTPNDCNSTDKNNVKLYSIVVNGDQSGNTCAQLKLTFQTKKPMTEEALNGLENAILHTLNKRYDLLSPEHLLQMVYDSATEYLREINFLDGT